MKCPNCDHDIDPEKPTALRLPDFVHSTTNLGHGEDCMLRAFLVAIADREDHVMEGLRLESINLDAFWDRVNPTTDWLEWALGLSKESDPTETLKITRVEKND